MPCINPQNGDCIVATDSVTSRGGHLACLVHASAFSATHTVLQCAIIKQLQCRPYSFGVFTESTGWVKKSKLLFLSESVNKTEKMGGM